MDKLTLLNLSDDIKALLEGIKYRLAVERDELTLFLDSSDLLAVMTSLRDSAIVKFGQLVDVTAVDCLPRSPRFDVVYHLLSYDFNMRLRVMIAADDEQPLPSLSGIYRSALWYEREVWDMYGLYFDNHPDLRRILTDYGFEGHPLRKDFPLTGYVEVRYCEKEKRVLYESVVLPQEYRRFDFSSPWEVMAQTLPGSGGDAQAVLPGDEKATRNEESANG